MKFFLKPLPCLLAGAASVVAMSLLIRDSFFVGLLSLAALGLITGAAFYSARKNSSGGLKWLVGGMLVLTVLALTNAPLRLAFAMFARDFDRLAKELEDDRRPAFPVWIGPFKVMDGGVRAANGIPYLITSGGHDEIYGFARDPRGAGFNLWSYTRLDSRWSYIEED